MPQLQHHPNDSLDNFTAAFNDTLRYSPGDEMLSMPEAPYHLTKLLVTFSGTYGATLVATIVNVCCYGFGLRMVMQYFRLHAKQDPFYLKLIIAVLITLATLETIFSSHQVYDIFVVKKGKTYLLVDIPFSVLGKHTSIYLTAFIAQIFLSSRIWAVCKRFHSLLRVMAIPTVLLALLQMIAGLVQVTVMGISQNYNNLYLQTEVIVKVTILQGTATAVCDISISATLCTIFHLHRSGLKTTDSLVNKLMIYAINRAAATSFFAILSTLLYYFCSGTFYFLIPLLANTHFYVISTVSVLTSREGLREEVNQSFDLSNLNLGNSHSQSSTGAFPDFVQMMPATNKNLE